MANKILFSNIGYAKGIDGSLWQHISRFGRHFYCELPVQEQVIGQIKNIIRAESPDLCCFVEIDQGSFHSGGYNQMKALVDEEYHFYDAADKYGENSTLGKMPVFSGKSNGFLSKEKVAFERLYFSRGAKRLIYRINLNTGVVLLFAHFSLQYKVRMLQFEEIKALVKSIDGEVIILADFNIMQGFSEVQSLLQETGLVLLNREDEHTFTFHTRRLTLDLCLCSPGLAARTNLRIIPQPYSDHAALLLSV